MAMVHMKDLLTHAYRNRYAVGAFEVVDLAFLDAILRAAEDVRSPVILNIVDSHARWFDLELLMAAVIRAARRASVPVAVHLDHCRSPDRVEAGIRLGCNGIMFDTAGAAFPVNVEQTRQIVRLAHGCGIPVEGASGHVAGIAEEPPASPATDSESVYTNVEEARVYVERTGVDFLAVSIGTVHGRSKTRMRLDFNRLIRIHEHVGVPLVVHGGTGLTDQQYHKLIDHGVAKINYYTALAEVAGSTIRDNIQRGLTRYDQLFTGTTEALHAEVCRCMQVWRSAGRAAEVLMQCRPWHYVEHVIVFNAETTDPERVNDMLIKGKQNLARIPGVLTVQVGKAVTDKAKYPFCWLIRFAHEEVVESYKHHPVHTDYADHHFRPLAADRITTDYEIIDTHALQNRFEPPLESNG